MNKKLLALVFMFTLLISGCTCSISKEEMTEKNNELNEDIKELKTDNENLNETKSIIDFYNTLTTENMNSLVLVESKNRFTLTRKYSNGVIIGNSGYNYYVLTDYNALTQSNVSYTVMDSYAISYSANLYSSDENTGLAILVFSIKNITSYATSIEVGELSDTYAYLDSMHQLNKTVILDNIKSSTVEYNNTTYTTYNIDNMSVSNGSILVNIDNKLMAIYSSKLNAFVGQDLIKEIVDFI